MPDDAFLGGSASSFLVLASSPAETGETNGHGTLVATAVGLILFWFGLFYLFVFTEPCWKRFIKTSSSKDHENNVYFISRILYSVVHTTPVASMSLWVLKFFLLDDKYDPYRFTYTENLGFCNPDLIESSGLPHIDAVGKAVGFAGLMFTTYMLVDLTVVLVHEQLNGPAEAIHHIVFFVAGLLIRGHCMLAFSASVLLSMEISTPFLNVYLFYRNRGESCRFTAGIAGIVFSLLFFIFRIVLNLYGIVVLVQNFAATDKVTFPERVPSWEKYFLLAAIGAGCIVQLVWVPQVIKVLKVSIRGIRGGDGRQGIVSADPGDTTTELSNAREMCQSFEVKLVHDLINVQQPVGL